MKRTSTILIFLMLVTSMQAQSPVAKDNYDERLSLNLDAATFVRDAEFFMPFAKGYTAAGFWCEPTLSYFLYNNEVQIRGGVRMVGVSGTEGLYQWRPILSITYNPNSWAEFTLGTLPSRSQAQTRSKQALLSSRHNAGDPIYDPERWFYREQEDGMQIVTHTRYWESDTWLNWEHFLEPWTADQERFTLGSSHRIKFSPNNNLFNVSIPMVFSGSHRGGQITTLDTCIETLFNESIGLQFDFYPTNRISTPPIATVLLPCYFFQNNSHTVQTTYQQGWGFYPQVVLTKEYGNSRNTVSLNMGYWYGYQYYSARGSAMFNSSSPFDPYYCDPYRNMVTAKVAFQHRMPKFSFMFDAEGYYDIMLAKFDFVVGLSMEFSNSWDLWPKALR